jgi:DNA-binding transcriptional LysR family regulator
MSEPNEERAAELPAPVSLFDSLAPPPTPRHLLYVGGKHLPPRVRAFIDFVQPRMTAALREL